MNIEKRFLKDLKAAEYNPRKKLQPGDADFEKIARSIEEFGYVDPIIINADGTIIGGHQRCTVLKHLGYEEAECVIVDVDKTKEKALNIALNKITGEWDEEKLKDLLIDLKGLDFEIDITGFNENDLSDLIEKFEIEEEITEDEFDIDESIEEIEKPKSKHGDIWILGNHRLMCSDSTNEEDVKKLMSGELADLVITDPPYNVDYKSKAEVLNKNRKHSEIQNDSMTNTDFYKFLLKVYENFYKNMKNGATIYVFHADTEGINFRRAFIDTGFKFAECLIWNKNVFALGRQDYQWKHEPCLYGWKEGSAHYFINDRTQSTVFDIDKDFNSMSKEELIEFIEKIKTEFENETTVINCNKPSKSDLHPTMKPVELFGKLIKNSSKKEWIVLDLFGGSGTTIIAAEQLGRKARIMELDEVYCDVIIKRWEDYTGKKAVLMNG